MSTLLRPSPACCFGLDTHTRARITDPFTLQSEQAGSCLKSDQEKHDWFSTHDCVNAHTLLHCAHHEAGSTGRDILAEGL